MSRRFFRNFLALLLGLVLGAGLFRLSHAAINVVVCAGTWSIPNTSLFCSVPPTAVDLGALPASAVVPVCSNGDFRNFNYTEPTGGALVSKAQCMTASNVGAVALSGVLVSDLPADAALLSCTGTLGSFYSPSFSAYQLWCPSAWKMVGYSGASMVEMLQLIAACSAAVCFVLGFVAAK